MVNSQDSTKATAKRINIYIRRHPFVLSSTESFTTSQRRAFIRDVYDFSRSLGLDKRNAQQQTIKAREMCGEDEYNSEDTSLENEIDDSEAILFQLQQSSRPQNNAIDSVSFQEDRAHESGNSATIAHSFNQPLVNLQKRKRDLSDSDSNRKPSRALNGPNASTTNGSSGEQKSKTGRPKQAKHSISTKEDSSPLQKRDQTRAPGHRNKHSSHADAQKSASQHTISSDVDIRSSTNHQDNTDGKLSDAQVPATTSMNKTSTHAVSNFAPPEVVMFSDDEDERPVIQKPRSSAPRPKTPPG